MLQIGRKLLNACEIRKSARLCAKRVLLSGRSSSMADAASTRSRCRFASRGKTAKNAKALQQGKRTEALVLRHGIAKAKRAFTINEKFRNFRALPIAAPLCHLGSSFDAESFPVSQTTKIGLLVGFQLDELFLAAAAA